MQAARPQSNVTQARSAAYVNTPAEKKPVSSTPQNRFYAKPSEVVKAGGGFAPPAPKPEQRSAVPQQAKGQAPASVRPTPGKAADNASSGGKVISPDPLDRPADDPEGFKFSDWLRSWRESQERN